MDKIAFVGDVHQKYHEYKQITEKHDTTIQVGDMGFDYKHCKSLNPSKHVFIGGNHDNWGIIRNCRNFLGRYGIWKSVFFVSGAKSIDPHIRTEGVNWWRDEELSHSECSTALELYVRTHPDIVVSHDCPLVVARSMFGYSERSTTRQLLGEMWARWKPKLWVFGHHHVSMREKIMKTQFVCLAELEEFHYNF